MKKLTISLLAGALFSILLMSNSVFAAGVDTQETSSIGVQYKTHIEDEGWETEWKTDGELSGTVGESKRLEALMVELTGDDLEDANIETWVHVQNKGDLGPFEMGEVAGTEDEGLRMESITLQLNNLSGYTLCYNVQVQNKGWLADEDDYTTWFVSGEEAGTDGESLRLEAIKIMLVENADLTEYQAALDSVNEDDYSSSSWATYQTVVAANTVTVLNTQSEVYQATINILIAQKSLTGTADLSDYEAALAAVTEDQVSDGWTAYQAVVEANVVTAQNTQEEVDQATANILAAQESLVYYADLTEFDDAIALYIEYGDDAEDTPYTTETWAEYTAKCEEYGTLTDGVWEYDVISKYNSQSIVDDATDDINNYLDALGGAADLSAFNAAKNIEASDGPYTTESFEVYEADSRVVAIVELPTSTLKGYSQGVIDAYTATLLALQDELLVVGTDLTDYEAALDAVKEKYYTPTSWETYEAVVDENVVTYDNTVTEVYNATKNILAAQDDLIYTAVYVINHANMTGSEFGTLAVGDNIIDIANDFISDAGIDESNYTVTFIRVDTGSTEIDEDTGEILTVGDTGTTVYFIITPIDGSDSADTINIGLDIE